MSRRLIFLLDCNNDQYDSNRYEWKTVYWPNTVHLSLFIEKFSDLAVLLDTHALPVLDHLCITFIRHNKHYLGQDFQVNNAVCITSRLRSLKLNDISLDKLLILLSSVHMPLLEKLTLIEIHDNSKSNNSISSI